MIIERAINSNVAVEFRNRFFDPLGLENTFMNIEEPLDGEIAHGNILGIDFSRVPRGAIDSMGWTAGAIFTTAEDLAMWTEALFKGNLVSENSLGQMLDFSETWTIYKGIEIKMGLGMIAIEYLPFGKIWNMAGQWPFYSTLMGYLPDHDIIVVVLLNEYIGNPLDVMEILLEPVVN
jgi:D-alanyl-D-alanine carboxypeptidase